MKRSLRTSTVVCAAVLVLLAPGLAGAQSILQLRCNLDSLDSGGAEARLLWARRCALIRNVQDPATVYDSGMPALTGGTLQDYLEDTAEENWSGENRYSAHTDNYEVNNSFINKLYHYGNTMQELDADNYYQWWRSMTRKKLRPIYPTFGTHYDTANSTNQQLFPHPELANCDLYYDAQGTQPATGVSFFINGYCEASCYTPEQKVLFSDGYVSILAATQALHEDVVTLGPDSSLDHIQLRTGRTHSYTAEFRDSHHPVIELRMASGGLLRVTVEHPVVNGSGRLVTAQKLKVGDALMKADGTQDTIVEAHRTQYFGKVYNLRPDSSDRISNVLVAEGYLVGSSLFQNDEVGYLNRIILHKHVPSSVIP